MTTFMNSKSVNYTLFVLVLVSVLVVANGFVPTSITPGSIHTHSLHPPKLAVLKAYSDDAPSDYDTSDIQSSDEKHVEVDENEEDDSIRDALKRELLLLASVTNRGVYATTDEENIAIDLVTQLEALNPTADPAHNCMGEWNLIYSSINKLFLVSPFFQSIRIALGDEQKSMAYNGFSLHDRATTSGRIGVIRQTINDANNQLVNEMDIELAVLPGVPVRIMGTVVTTSSLEVVSDDLWEVQVETTQVKGSNVPFLNQFLEEPQVELPVGSVYNTLSGKVPVVPLKTFYLDEALRITRDVDDNFYVFSRL